MKDDPLISFRRKPGSIDTDSLEAFAEDLRRRIARGRTFHCRITGDCELQALNHQFRGKNYPTDVLSFPAVNSEGAQGGESSGHLGDIAISFARARAQAKEYGHTVEEELRILLLHGVLHLAGFDHETDGGEMERAENRWRRALSLPTGLIGRAEMQGVSE